MQETARARPEAADVAFAAVLLATFAFYVYETRTTYFYADEWLLADRGRSLGDFLQPYNGHLSIVYIAVFRVLFQLFHLKHHLPFRLVGIASLCAVPLALHLTARRRIGAGAAGVLAVAVLWFRGVQLEAGALNHWLALAATVVVAAALLDDRRRGDWVVFGALAFALCSAGGGIAAVGGAVVFLLCTRPHGRRWLAVLVPTAAWGVWWLVEGRGSAAVPESVQYDLGDTIRVSWEGVRSSFDGLVLGQRWAGLALTVLFGALLLWRLRRGPAHAANHLAWTAGLLVWWVGVISSRGALAQTDVFRYRFVGAVLIILAVLPTEPVAWRLRVPPVPAAAGVLVVAALLAAVNHDDVSAWAKQQRAFSRATRELVLVASVRPPLALALPRGLGAVDIAAYRRAIELYGAPQRATRQTIDGQLVRAGIRLEPVRFAIRTSCRPQARTLTVGPQARLALTAPDRPVVVELRRFGDRFVRVGTIPAGQRRVLGLPGLGSHESWQVRAVGACR
jgi:hypothetical protein